MQVFWPILVLSAFLQTTNASAPSTVTDPAGARVHGGQIVLQNVATGVQQANTANESGVYLFPSVPPGVYRLTVQAPGFARYVVNELRVQAAGRLDVNAAL